MITRTLLTLSSLCALLVGCGSNTAEQDSDPGPPRGEVHGEVAERPEGTSAVEGELETLLGQMRMVEGKRVVDFELRNRGERDLEIAYRVEWMDRRGNAVADDGSWVLVHLPPGGSVPVEASAPSRAAESWSVRAVEPGTAEN